jgi:hypothetical protein
VPKSLTITIRTQFRRDVLLRRTIESARAFVAAAGRNADLRVAIVTDSGANPPDYVPASIPIIRAHVPAGTDSRYRLVGAAAEQIESDYYYFVDDDDWLFPNEAERLVQIINVAPNYSLLFVTSQHFREESSEWSAAYPAVRPGHNYPADLFLRSLSGQNHSPFCGVIFGRGALKRLPPELLATVTYYEDYMTLLLSLLDARQLPIIVDKLLAGISIRPSGNAVTETDRTKWNASMSEVVSHLVNSQEVSQLISLSDGWGDDAEHLRQQLFQMRQSTSWRITAPARFLTTSIRQVLKSIVPAQRRTR